MNRPQLVILLTIIGLVLGVSTVYFFSTTNTDHYSGDKQVNQESLLGFMASTVSKTESIDIAGNSGDIAQIKVVDEDDPNRIVLDFALPGFSLETILVNGLDCTRVTMPGYGRVMDPDKPELPMLATSLTVPSSGEVSYRIIEHKFREIKVYPVEPSLGHISRNINPATVKPVFDPLYRNDGVWPEENVVLSKPFILRKLRGINIRIHPFVYDAGRGALVVTEHLKLEIITSDTGGINKNFASTNVSGSGEFEHVYNKLFSNYSPQQNANKYNQLQTRGKLLVVTDPAFVVDMMPFVLWKQQLGIPVELITTSQVGGTAAGIKQAIQLRYDQPGSLTWVILVGDIAQVPTNVGSFDGTDSDSMYGMLAGNDDYPDIFVSRISASNSDHVQTQVAKFIDYEKYPDTGSNAAWYSKATGIASNEGTPSDYERADDLRSELLNYNFTQVDQIYEGQGGTPEQIRNSINSGCSLINYLGHGSGVGWSSVAYSKTDVHNLTNNGRLPWIIDVSCTNGDFSMTECFAEAWLRAGTPASPDGAVAMIAASSESPWTPPTVMQAEIVSLLTKNQANTIGDMYYSGLMEVLDLYGGLRVATQVVEQNVVFGDCSMMVRTDTPNTFVLGQTSELNEEHTSWTANISGPAGSSVALTKGNILYGSALTDATGRAVVEITSSLLGVTSLDVTIAGYNMVPYFSTVELSQSTDTPPDESELAPVSVKLLGNYPNPFNPDTRIVFEIPREMRVKLVVYDIKGQLVQILANEKMSAGEQHRSWNGADSNGRNMASGIYLYRLVTDDGIFTGRMLLSK